MSAEWAAMLRDFLRWLIGRDAATRRAAQARAERDRAVKAAMRPPLAKAMADSGEEMTEALNE